MHWYKRNGAPLYEVPYADKKKGMRATTLSDARKLQLVPSVTTITSIIAKPGLENWKVEQAVMSALTIPTLPGETDEEFIARITKDSQEEAKHAAQVGTDIHHAIEACFEERKPEKYEDIGVKVYQYILKMFPDIDPNDWIAETSFAHPLGFGGKVDLHCRKGDGIVIDYKTKKELVPGKRYAWDDQAMQLIAYAVGLGIPQAKLYNIFVDWEGNIDHHEWHEDMDRELMMFTHALGVWQFKHKYFPGWDIESVGPESKIVIAND